MRLELFQLLFISCSIILLESYEAILSHIRDLLGKNMNMAKILTSLSLSHGPEQWCISISELLPVKQSIIFYTHLQAIAFKQSNQSNVIQLSRLYGHFSRKLPIILTKGMRIAQLIIEKICHPILLEVDTLEKTERSCKGFGSNGLGKNMAKILISLSLSLSLFLMVQNSGVSLYQSYCLSNRV